MHLNSTITTIIILAAVVIITAFVAVGCRNGANGKISESNTTPLPDYNISVKAAAAMIAENADNPDFVILDVRTPAEFADTHLDNAVNINFTDASFSSAVDALDKNKTYLLYCRSGNRSSSAHKVMMDKGFENVYNMLGGITKWPQQ